MSCISPDQVHQAHGYSTLCPRTHQPGSLHSLTTAGAVQVVFPPQPRQFNGFTLDEETIEFVPLGWFELRVRAPNVSATSRRCRFVQDALRALPLAVCHGPLCVAYGHDCATTTAYSACILEPPCNQVTARPTALAHIALMADCTCSHVKPIWQHLCVQTLHTQCLLARQGYDKGREKFIYQARQSSLAGREFGDGVLNARRVDSATMRRNRSASASSYHLPADLGAAQLRSGLRPARWVRF